MKTSSLQEREHARAGTGRRNKFRDAAGGSGPFDILRDGGQIQRIEPANPIAEPTWSFQLCIGNPTLKCGKLVLERSKGNPPFLELPAVLWCQARCDLDWQRHVEGTPARGCILESVPIQGGGFCVGRRGLSPGLRPANIRARS